MEESSVSVYWRTGVLYQQLFAKGPRSEYFEVARGHDIASLETERRRTEVAVQQATQAFQAKSKEARKKEMDIIEEMGDLAAPNSWLRRLGSTAHLKDFSDKKQLLRDLISLKYTLKPGDPDAEDDSELRHIHAAVRRLIRKSAGATRPGAVSWNVLFEVNRKELHKERSTPFHFRFKRQTRKKYIAVCLQFFAYAVRAMSCENPSNRPPFKLTESQAAAFDKMMDYAGDLVDIDNKVEPIPSLLQVNELHQSLEDAALAFYISVLDHFTKGTEYDSILVSFLTVLSIRDDKTWETYANFTPKLSAIMAISRVFLVKHTVDKRDLYIKKRVEEGQSRQEAEEKSPGHFEIMSEMTRRFLVGGAEGWDTTPTQFIIRLRNYGMAASGQEAIPGSVSWDNEDVIYKGIRINVLGVQSMLQAALQRAETLLYKHLLFCEEYKDQPSTELGLPEIPWDELIDNAADASIGHSFVDNLFQLLPESNGWTFCKMWINPTLRKAWVEGDSEAEFKLIEKKAWYYGNHLEEFLECLLFIMHLCGGQAARSLELLTLRHRNTANGGIRNILYDRGLIMLVSGYHKGFSKTERVKVIHRFLPREVRALVIYYLWLVLPFWEDIQANVWDKTELSANLWAPEETLDDLNDDDGKNGYGTGSDGDESDEEEDISRRPQRRRTRAKVRSPGPGPHWTSARMTRILRRMSVKSCKKGFTISSWRHLSIAITRRYFRNGTTAHTALIGEADEGYGSDSDSEVEQDSPWDAQACHGSLTAGLVYGRLITEGCFETNERRVNFRFISEEWHGLLGFPSAINGFRDVLIPGRKRKTPSLHYEAMRNLQLRRWKTLRRINIDQELGRLYGDHVRFRGKQREAVDAIMMNKSPVVVIMGTGSGKSLCFMLPAASCPGGLTVVIVPLVSLQGDLMDRCQKLKISCAEWRSDRVPGDVSIVFVTPESAMTKRFLDFLESRRVMAKVDRIVVDECHTIMEGCLTFRPKLRELGTLALVGLQMVYLTATLPPADEAAFFTMVNARREDVVMIRAKTTRRNVAYSVRSVTATTAEEAIAAVVEQARVIIDQKLEEHPRPAKIIVYCQRVEATEDLAGKLGCDAYHRDRHTGREGGKAQVLDERHETGAVRGRSGRAGRDGQRSEAIVIRLDAQGSSKRPRPLVAEHAATDSYIRGDVCRRVILDSVMDGRSDREGCEEGEEVCDVCQQQVVEESREDDNDDDGGGLGEDREEYDMRQRELQVEDARYQAITLAAEEHQQFQDYRKKLLQQALQGCIFCSLANICGDGAHSGLRCQEASAIDSEVAEAYQLARFGRGNIIGLLNAIETLTGHSSSIAERLSWTKRRLNNQGDQYDLRSHLAARHGEVEPSTQHQPLLERFLHQREPPEWDVEPVDGEEVEETTEEDDSPLGEDDDDDDLEDAGLNDSRSSVVFIG
ncbi:ATP-dependent DNA helicase hus2/rqh1 [Fusarium oxysporum f. sp. conglutinans]|nr:ATP-dependent DNA helicase hus2/rqh1 [Fusarium oxysporum f. sp. conglutinans]